MGFAVHLVSETGNMWVRARVMTQTHLGWGRPAQLTSYCSPRFTPPRWLGAGVIQALGPVRWDSSLLLETSCTEDGLSRTF